MTTSNALKNLSDEKFAEVIQQRRRVRMSKIDEMPKDLRECVHEYGANIVNSLVVLGIKKPAHIRHIVETVLDEFSPTRGSPSSQGTRATHIDTRREPRV